MGGLALSGDSLGLQIYSLFNRKICIASLAHLLPALPLGTKWRLS